jgi:hypothetical protein
MRRLSNLQAATSQFDSSSNSGELITVRSGVNPDGFALDRGTSLSRPLAPPQPRLSQALEPRLVAVQFRHGDLTLQDQRMSWYSNDRGDAARRLCTSAHHAHHSVLSQCHNCTEAAVSRHNGVPTFRHWRQGVDLVQSRRAAGATSVGSGRQLSILQVFTTAQTPQVPRA